MAYRILSIFGTRPEAIKMAPVVRVLQRRSSQFESLVCLTGQHREMLDQIMRSFDLTADFDLNVMQKSQSPAEVAGKKVDLYDPAGPTRPRFAVLFLHGIGLETLVDKPAFTRLFDELHVRVAHAPEQSLV